MEIVFGKLFAIGVSCSFFRSFFFKFVTLDEIVIISFFPVFFFLWPLLALVL